MSAPCVLAVEAGSEIPVTPLTSLFGVDLRNLGGSKVVPAQWRNRRRSLALEQQTTKSLNPSRQFFVAVTMASKGKAAPSVRIAGRVNLGGHVQREQLACMPFQSRRRQWQIVVRNCHFE